MFEWLTTRSVPMPGDDGTADRRLRSRNERAVRLAQQSWREFFTELAIRSAIVLGGVAIVAILVKLLFG